LVRRYLERAELSHDRLVAHGRQTLHLGRFFLCSQPLFYPLASILRECVTVGLGDLVGMFDRRMMEETDLLTIAATPLAKQQM